MTPLSVQDYLAPQAQFFSEDFIFVACQHGAEGPIKQELTKAASVFRLAFSRPGLITFKVVRNAMESENKVRSSMHPTVELPQHPLIRQSGWVLKQVRGTHAGPMVEEVIAAVGGDWNCLHVFPRDIESPGENGFEPGVNPLCSEIGSLLQKHWERPIPVNVTSSVGTKVLDVILVEPNLWLIGHHVVTGEQICTGWPGGTYSVPLPDGAISRAYLKMAEAIEWSQLPIKTGDAVVEIGSAPGGSTQRLLDMGLVVTGVDPAEMHPILLEQPRFTHWRAKSKAIKRKKYSQFRWLTADANVAPNYTLDAVEDIVTYPTSRFEGLLLTLKLSNYELLDQLNSYLKRIGSWGFTRVQARQLAHNRRELCVAALRA